MDSANFLSSYSNSEYAPEETKNDLDVPMISSDPPLRDQCVVDYYLDLFKTRGRLVVWFFPKKQKNFLRFILFLLQILSQTIKSYGNLHSPMHGRLKKRSFCSIVA